MTYARLWYQLDSLRAFFSLVSSAGLSSTAFHLLLLWVYAKRRAQDAWAHSCKVLPGQWNHTILRKKRLFILFVILLVLTSWSRLCIFLESKWHKNWQSFWSVSPKRLQWVQLDSLWAEDLRTSWLQLCLESFWNALHRALRCLAGLSKDVKVQTSTGRFYNSAVCPSMSIIGSNNCHIACRRKRHLKYFKVFTVELIVQCTICSSGVLLLSTKPYMELYCIHLYTVLIYTHKYNIYLNILYLQNSAFQLSPACATAQCHLFESSPRSAEKVQASIHPPWRWAHTSNV